MFSGRRELMLDLGLALVEGALIVLVIHGRLEAGSRPPDALAYSLGLSVAALLLVRRRWPGVVLVLSAVLMHVYLMLDYPAFSPSLLLGVPLYSAVMAGQLRLALGMVAFIFLGYTAGRLYEGDAPLPVVVGAFYETVLLGLVIALGEVIRNRRAWQAEVHARLERAEHDALRESQRRVTEERLRIARDIHDVVAHTIAVVVVQAGLAADILDKDPEQAREALRTIRGSSRAALNELRATIGVLRGGEVGDGAPRGPTPGLGQMQHLIDAASAGGLRVEVQRQGEERAPPAAVDHTAYRILQEALTNVLRHARAQVARVEIQYTAHELTIRVVDDGTGSAVASRSGHGLRGMAERAAALGGTLHAGSRPEGGFEVRARLPLDPAQHIVGAAP